jgi:hypothetical protein
MTDTRRIYLDGAERKRPPPVLWSPVPDCNSNTGKGALLGWAALVCDVFTLHASDAAAYWNKCRCLAARGGAAADCSGRDVCDREVDRAEPWRCTTDLGPLV